MKKNIKSFVAIFLVIVMFATMPCLQIFAGSANGITENISSENNEAYTTEEIEMLGISDGDEITENEHLREENVKHFSIGGGKYTAVVYNEPVHRLDENGKYVDIDNRLEENENGYKTSDGRVRFDNENAALELAEKGYNIKLTYISENREKKTPLVNNHKKREEIEITGTAAEKLEKLKNVNNESLVKYSNISANSDIEYVLKSNDIKENIIVKGRGGNYTYGFILDLEGLYAVLENNTVKLYDNVTNEEKYLIPAPYMYDAAGVYSYDVEYGLASKGEGTYILVVAADSEFINDLSRSFPVTIDPTIEQTRSSNVVEDTYICSCSAHASTNFGSATKLYVSNGSSSDSGTKNVLVRPYLPSIPSASTVTYATLHVPYYFDNVTSGRADVYLKEVIADWSVNGVTWNTMGAYTNRGLSTSSLAFVSLYASSSINSYSPGWQTFNITNTVQSWYNGTLENNGLALTRASGTDDPIINPYDAHDGNNIYLTIEYEYDFADGVYSLSNKAYTNYYLASENSSASSGANIILENNAISPAITFEDADSANVRDALFKITNTPDGSGRYIIRLMTNNSLTISFSGESLVTKEIPLSDSEVAAADTFYITQNANGSFVFSPYTANTQYIAVTSSMLTLGKTSTTTETSSWNLVKYAGEDKAGSVVSYPQSWTYNGIEIDIPTHISGYIWNTKASSTMQFQISVREDYSDRAKGTWNADNRRFSFSPNKLGTIMFKLLVTSSSGLVSQGYITKNIIPEEDRYLIQNVGNNKYIEVEDSSSNVGAYIQQNDQHSGSNMVWIVEHPTNAPGYVRIKSENSNLYLGIDSSDTSLVKQLASGTDYTLWKIETTDNYTLKFICKATEASGMVLSLPIGGTEPPAANGTNMSQTAYVNNNDYRDEWKLKGFAYSVGTSEFFEDYGLENGELYKSHENWTSAGYISSYKTDDNENLTQAEFSNDLLNSSILYFSSHGNQHCLAFKEKPDYEYPYIRVLDGATTYNDAVCVDVSNYNMENVELCILAACSTATYNSDEDTNSNNDSINLADTMLSNGIDCVLAWYAKLPTISGSMWIEKFQDKLVEGYSVTDAVNYANTFYHLLPQVGKLKCVKILGNKNIVLNKYVETKSLRDITEEGLIVCDLDYLGVVDNTSTANRSVSIHGSANLTALENALELKYNFTPASKSNVVISVSGENSEVTTEGCLTYTYRVSSTSTPSLVFSFVVEEGRIKYIRMEEY